MSRHHSLQAVAIAGLLVPLAVGTREALRAPATQPPPTAGERPGALRLINRGPVGLTVEVRPALHADCSAGLGVMSREVRAGAAWVVSSSQPLCVRREKLGAGGQRRMQPWERKELPKGRTEEVDL